MKLTPLSPVGAVVEGIRPARLGRMEAEALRGALAERGVLVLREQQLDDEEFVSFLRSLGELAFTSGETPVPQRPELNLISNVGRETPPVSNWHVDTSYISRPPAFTALRAVTIPEAGGETLFSNQYRAYETLDGELRLRLRGRTIRHVVSGVDPGPGEEREAEHPIFRLHPLTGRTALYLTSPARCAAISGFSEAETRETVAALLAHSTQDENVLRHRWRPGDVVIWDNSAVLHRADHSAVVGDRVMHRGMVASYG